MQIVTDRGADLTAEQIGGLAIHYAPLTITLDGKSYVSGVDIQHDEFYQLLLSAAGMPTTSLPSAGEFAGLYRQLASVDPDILSVHISSGLSGTFDAAKMGAALVPEANVTVVDTKTLSGAEGWQVEAAARAAKAGWPLERIIATLDTISRVSDTLFTLPDLKYLIHGGRISHIKGLLAQALNIKPLIGVNKDTGKYEQHGQVRTLQRAIEHIADVIARHHKPGSKLRVQVMHASNPEGAARLREHISSLFECIWLPTGDIAPVLGAHTGPGLVGAVFAPLAAYPALP
jgi:DegV family protein with EDD domain